MIDKAIESSYPEISRRVHEAACNLKGFALEYCIRIFLQDLIEKGWRLTPPDD